MIKIYVGAVAFGLTLLIASFVLGGKDTDHGSGHHAHSDGNTFGFGLVPITSLRFWVFLFAFGGITGLVLSELETHPTITAVGAIGIGWIAGAGAVAAIRSLSRHSVSSELKMSELVGASGKLVLPVGPNRPGKVRIDHKGRIEDLVANVAGDDVAPMSSGTHVLIVAEGTAGTVLVAPDDNPRVI